MSPPGKSLLLLAAALSAAAAARAAEEPGVFPDRVLFGQSAVFSGETQALGANMRLGIELAFQETEAFGGVHGRAPALISLDDAYEPEAAIVNTRQLIGEEEVFALIGAVGTPTARSAIPIAEAAGVPYIAPFSGAEFMREAGLTGVVNLRASYYQETEEMVARLTEDLGVERVGVIYQDDSFGLSGYEGIALALARRGMEAAGVSVYPRNTRAVKIGLLELRDKDPEAVIMVGSYQPVAELVSWARRIDFNPVFMTLSFAGSVALADALGSDGGGVYITQVVPFPFTGETPVVRQYLAALATHAPEADPGFVSLEGYLAGRLVVAALDRAGPALSRGNFLAAIRGMRELDLGGFELSFGEDSQGSDAVFLTEIDAEGRYRPAARLERAGRR